MKRRLECGGRMAGASMELLTWAALEIALSYGAECVQHSTEQWPWTLFLYCSPKTLEPRFSEGNDPSSYGQIGNEGGDYVLIFFFFSNYMWFLQTVVKKELVDGWIWGQGWPHNWHNYDFLMLNRREKWSCLKAKRMFIWPLNSKPCAYRANVIITIRWSALQRGVYLGHRVSGKYSVL